VGCQPQHFELCALESGALHGAWLQGATQSKRLQAKHSPCVGLAALLIGLPRMSASICPQFSDPLPAFVVLAFVGFRCPIVNLLLVCTAVALSLYVAPVRTGRYGAPIHIVDVNALCAGNSVTLVASTHFV